VPPEEGGGDLIFFCSLLTRDTGSTSARDELTQRAGVKGRNFWKSGFQLPRALRLLSTTAKEERRLKLHGQASQLYKTQATRRLASMNLETRLEVTDKPVCTLARKEG